MLGENRRNVTSSAPSVLNLVSITPDNADRVTRLARLGKGAIFGVTFSSEGDSLVVGSTAGVGLYDIEILDEVRFIEPDEMCYTNWTCLSPDGRWLASATWDQRVGVWDISSGQLVRTLDVDAPEVKCIAFSASGRIVTSESWGAELRVWDLSDGKLLSTLRGPSGDVPGVAFSSDGQVLASWVDGPHCDPRVHLFRAADGEPIHALDDASGVTVALSPNGTLVLASKGLEEAGLWQVSSGTLQSAVQVEGERCAAFSPDGRYVAVGLYRGEVNLHRAADGRLVRALEGHKEQVKSIAFSPDGTKLVSLAGNEIRLWCTPDGQLLRRSRSPSCAATCLAFSNDSRFLATGLADGSVRIWRTPDRRLVCALDGHRSRVSSVCFSPDANLLVSGADDGTTKLWRLSDQEQLGELKGCSRWGTLIAFSPDGQLMAVRAGGHSLADDGIHLWPVQQQLATRAISYRGLTSRLTGLAFAPDSRRLAVGRSNGIIDVYDGVTGTCTSLDAGSFWRSGGTSVTFSPDGRWLLAAVGERVPEADFDNIHEDSCIALWRVSSGELLYRFDLSRKVARGAWFSPDGKLFAVAYQRVLDESYLELFRSVDGSSVGTVNIDFEDIVLSPDWKVIASVSGGIVELWGAMSRLAYQPEKAELSGYGKPWVFTSEEYLSVFGRSQLEQTSYYRILGDTPGAVVIPANYDLRFESFGVESKSVKDGFVEKLFQELAGYEQIQSLDLSGFTGITDTGLSELTELASLTKLNLSGCSKITDAGLACLKALTNLTSLKLGGERVDAPPEYSYVEEGPRITDVGLEHLKALANLASLDLSYCDQITDDMLMHLKAFTNLTELNLEGCKQFTDAGLAQLKTLSNLTSLNLGFCDQITDEGLRHLKALTNLTELSLFFCRGITPIGIQHLERPGLSISYMW